MPEHLSPPSNSSWWIASSLLNLLVGAIFPCHNPWLLFFLDTTTHQGHGCTALLSGGGLTGSRGTVAQHFWTFLHSEMQDFQVELLKHETRKDKRHKSLAHICFIVASHNIQSYPHNTTTYQPQCSHRHQKSKYIITRVDELSIL